MKVMDEVAVPLKLREEVQKFYPNARLGLLKSGGNFPYLSRADEVNMLIEVNAPHTHNQTD
jgi:maspardin